MLFLVIKSKISRMKNILITIVLLAGFTGVSTSQMQYSGKIETGFMKYRHETVAVEPGPGWRGYYLNEEQNGIDITVINGLTWANRTFFAGAALGYLNFQGINGLSVLSDFEYLPLKKKLTPFINMKLGYSHIWNQYAGGRGTVHFEPGLGVNYTPHEKFGIYLSSGMLFTQQSLLIPLTVGIRY
jgi:hypothetical protein